MHSLDKSPGKQAALAAFGSAVTKTTTSVAVVIPPNETAAAVVMASKQARRRLTTRLRCDGNVGGVWDMHQAVPVVSLSRIISNSNAVQETTVLVVTIVVTIVVTMIFLSFQSFCLFFFEKKIENLRFECKSFKR
jgi:hypothetical protein